MYKRYVTLLTCVMENYWLILNYLIKYYCCGTIKVLLFIERVFLKTKLGNCSWCSWRSAIYIFFSLIMLEKPWSNSQIYLKCNSIIKMYFIKGECQSKNRPWTSEHPRLYLVALLWKAWHHSPVHWTASQCAVTSPLEMFCRFVFFLKLFLESICAINCQSWRVWNTHRDTSASETSAFWHRGIRFLTLLFCQQPGKDLLLLAWF